MDGLLGFLMIVFNFDFVAPTEYCTKYAIATGVYYSSCGGYCCGPYGTQECCYHSYNVDQDPAIGLGAAFGIIFGLFLSLLILFTAKAICNAQNKKTRLIEPNKDIEKVLHKEDLDLNTASENKPIIYVIS